MKCNFKLVFNDYQYCPYVTSKLSDNKTRIPWSAFLEKIISDFIDKGYTFNHIAEMHIITIAIKLNMSYDFYNKHNMHAVERKLNMIIVKNPPLKNKLDSSKRHPLSKKFSQTPLNN